MRPAALAAALAVALASPAALAAEPLRRLDGSEISWTLDRQGGSGRQGVLVLAQGSGCLPAGKSAAVNEAKGLLPNFAVVTVEKYGVTPHDAPADDMADCPPAFFAGHTISQRAADYVQVVEALRKQPWFDGRVVLFGGSEGGAAIAQAAADIRPTAVVIFSSGIGQPLRQMFKAVVPPAVAATADAEFDRAIAEPDRGEAWGGSSYRWWADAVDRIYVRDLLRARAPVLIVHGGRDQSAPIASARAAAEAYAAAGRGAEVRLLEYPELDHFMQDAAGVNHRSEVLAEIAAWLRRVLPPVI